MMNDPRHKSAAKSGVATRRLRREIVLMLAIKAALLYGLWFAFFSEPQLPRMTEGMDPARVASTLIPAKATGKLANP